MRRVITCINLMKQTRNTNICLTCSVLEILFVPDYELALMIDQTHDIVKLAIPSGSLDFTGGVCMAADKNGMFKPDLEKAASTSEFVEAWAAEADVVETQILSTR